MWFLLLGRLPIFVPARYQPRRLCRSANAQYNALVELVMPPYAVAKSPPSLSAPLFVLEPATVYIHELSGHDRLHPTAAY